MENFLKKNFKNKLIIPESLNEIPLENYMVYILTYNENPIVIGYGKKNRAKVIFDDLENVTLTHIKSLLIRIYYLFGNSKAFQKFLILTENKIEAIEIENKLHSKFGGNKNTIPLQFRKKLFCGIGINSNAFLFLEMALVSSYGGLSDLKKWRKMSIIDDKNWAIISKKIKFQI